MKVRIVLNVGVAYCSARDVAETLDQLNFFESVKVFDKDLVEVVVTEDDLLRLYDEGISFEDFIKNTLETTTDALRGVYVYQVLNFNDVIDDVEILGVDSIDDVINSRLFEVYNDDPCDELSAIPKFAIDDVVIADRIIHLIAERFGLEIVSRMDSADVIVLCEEGK